jgi:hypothetical protein
MSYLDIKRERMGILEYEINLVLKVKALQKDYISSLINLESKATMEQITKCSGFSSYYFYKIRLYLNKIRLYLNKIGNYIKSKTGYSDLNSRNSRKRRALKRLWQRCKRNAIKRMSRKPGSISKRLSKICIIPLPHFSSYSNFPEDRPKSKLHNNDIIPYKNDSLFTQIASNQNTVNLFRQSDTVFDILLQYKWKTFVRWRFWFVICAIHATYYITYSTGVLFAQDLYGYIPGGSITNPGHIISIILMSGAGLVFIFQEFSQFLHAQSPLDYFITGFNWLDISAFVFPLVTLLQLTYNWEYQVNIEAYF